jgi:hypothetical protein
MTIAFRSLIPWRDEFGIADRPAFELASEILRFAQDDNSFDCPPREVSDSLSKRAPFNY